MLPLLAAGLCFAQDFSQVQKMLDLPQKPKLLIVGVYHFANPGLDLAKAELDDHLAEKRQREIAALNAKLATFNPTHIAVEAPFGNPATQERYQSWLAGNATLTVNETEQIGFRLGKLLRLPAIHPIDTKLDMDFEKFMKAADPSVVGELNRAVAENQKVMAGLKDRSVAANLRMLNSPQADRLSNGMYLRMLRNPKNGQSPGADLITDWWKRNFLWIANLSTVAKDPKDRVLLICGAGHANLLRSILRDSLDYEVVRLEPYLPA